MDAFVKPKHLKLFMLHFVQGQMIFDCTDIKPQQLECKQRISIDPYSETLKIPTTKNSPGEGGGVTGGPRSSIFHTVLY